MSRAGGRVGGEGRPTALFRPLRWSALPCSGLADESLPEGMDFKDLRQVYGLLEEDLFVLGGRAVQIVEWDRTHQYCGRCGSRTHTKEKERAKVCPQCG